MTTSIKEFQIVPFTHGTEIMEMVRKDEKVINLGCYPVAYDEYRHFGLYYKGKIPALNDVMKELDKMIQYGDNIYRGWVCTYTKKDVRHDVKIVLKG